MDTTELGVGFNPVPDKCFKFKCECITEVIFTIWAENFEKAKQYLNDRDYDEKDFEDIIEIGNILDYEEEE